MTGRQYTRVGVPGVFGPTGNTGLPLNETTVADQMKRAGYATAICGKWHLGQREMFLPGNRGFDEYLGIPYSDDMGGARATQCPHPNPSDTAADAADVTGDWRDDYCDAGFCLDEDRVPVEHSRRRDLRGNDPAGTFLPLVYQHHSTDNGKLNTSVLEQPLDFTHLAEKYSDFVTGFVKRHKADPFFLYVPFSHVHTTDPHQPEEQYAGCQWKGKTSRGSFGDALAEVDWIVGNLVATLQQEGLDKNTLILFTGDNGPWMVKGTSGGSTGLLYGRASGYWNVGKGSTWEGGIHEAAFAHWPGTIAPQTKSDEIVSSMDLLPTASQLAGVSLPAGVVYDGRDMSDVLLDRGASKSKHDFLFFYGGAGGACKKWKGPSAVRWGDYKAHFATGPGLGGCTGCEKQCFCDDPSSGSADDCAPLLFDVRKDPSEAYPLDNKANPQQSSAILAALRKELQTFTWGKLVAPADGPGEGPGTYGVCCDRAQGCDCDGPLPKTKESKKSE